MRVFLVISLLFCCLSVSLSQKTNPFTVYHNEDTSSAQVTSVPPVNIDADLNKIEGDNPFNVSHIPIRKNQYKKIESLNTTQSDSNKENISISYLPLWIIFLSLCLLAAMLYLDRNHINTLFRSVLNDNFLRMKSFESDSNRLWPYAIGYGLFVVNISLFISLTLTNVFSVNQSHLLFWCLLFTALFFVGKHIVNALFSWVFNYEKEAKIYHFLIISLRNIMSIFYLSLNIIYVFGSQSWHKSIALIGVVIYIIFLLSRYYRGINISRNYINSNFFQFFIYFCAFELAPWVIIYKLVNDLL